MKPYAFIRVKDEDLTLKQSLNSILGAINRGIIVYNECNDFNISIIKEFCEKNKGFIYKEYPYEVLEIEHNIEEREYKKKLSDYYNFALSFIPENEWLIKIDCDQIYEADLLKDSFNMIRNDYDSILYFRMNLHIKDNKVYLFKDEPITEHYDHWIIKNNNLSFYEKILEHDFYKIKSYEMLDINRKVNFKVYKYLTTYHFRYMKNRRNIVDDNNLVHISQYDKVLSPQYIERIKPFMLDEEHILKRFNDEI